MESKYICQIPTWALSYLINADPSGLDGNDIATVDNWKNSLNGHNVSVYVQDDDVFFSNWPEFGLPCDVQNCIVIVA